MNGAQRGQRVSDVVCDGRAAVVDGNARQTWPPIARRRVLRVGRVPPPRAAGVWPPTGSLRDSTDCWPGWHWRWSPPRWRVPVHRRRLLPSECAGKPVVSTGSRTTTSALISSPQSQIFACVGVRKHGGPGRLGARAGGGGHADIDDSGLREGIGAEAVVVCARLALRRLRLRSYRHRVPSPPPMETTALAFSRRATSAAASTWAMVGSLFTSSNRSTMQAALAEAPRERFRSCRWSAGQDPPPGARRSPGGPARRRHCRSWPGRRRLARSVEPDRV